MPFVKGGEVVEDSFVKLDDGAPVPRGGAILVSGERLLEQAADLLASCSRLGVGWANSADVAQLEPYLADLAVVALEFPSFRDGRAYSQARLLRERYGFGGELRATGQVLRDQFGFMLRAGFDSFEVEKAGDVAGFAETAARYSVVYQPTGDGRVTALRSRLQQRQSQSI